MLIEGSAFLVPSLADAHFPVPCLGVYGIHNYSRVPNLPNTLAHGVVRCITDAPPRHGDRIFIVSCGRVVNVKSLFRRWTRKRTQSAYRRIYRYNH